MDGNKHIIFRVFWSEEDGEYVGTCAQYPSLSHLDESEADALAGIMTLVADVVAEDPETLNGVGLTLSDSDAKVLTDMFMFFGQDNELGTLEHLIGLFDAFGLAKQANSARGLLEQRRKAVEGKSDRASPSA